MSGNIMETSEAISIYSSCASLILLNMDIFIHFFICEISSVSMIDKCKEMVLTNNFQTERKN